MDWTKLKTQKEWKVNLQSLLMNSDEAVMRAIIAVYSNQTAYEREIREADIVDNQGFNKYDAPYMCKLAEQLQDRWYLSGAQLETARRKMTKYWRQLMIISKRNLGME